ncbi:MAG: ABC transporter ATP-binding protein [Armatimonadota bacterium]|nr:ABC transporter ATP-binding protein [Armatimonadota bacterium]MDR7486444.1 ABC transporter ATP-binding protein [Armatimonadota bacterium]MDR7532210.1 ABC transporter ATP-binding protein [Armatimonadota bacterium]MDR7537215.1 ABC transporter ATP-binding protein [Armatimonadota bacterium]
MPLIEVAGVTKRFGGLVALDGISLAVHDGEILGIIGPNGAGKSTLFEIISGFQRPTAGRVVFDGRDITGCAPHRAAAWGIGRTFQIVRPFPNLTVRDNVLVGAYLRHGWAAVEAAEDVVEDVLEFTALAAFADRPARELTLARKKRLELARALALRPRVLLLDEVLAGLNPVEVADATRLIRAIRQRGITLVMVEHVMQAVMDLCERIVVLHYGRKLAEGPPDAIRQDPQVIDAYLGQADADHH